MKLSLLSASIIKADLDKQASSVPGFWDSVGQVAGGVGDYVAGGFNNGMNNLLGGTAIQERANAELKRPFFGTISPQQYEEASRQAQIQSAANDAISAEELQRQATGAKNVNEGWSNIGRSIFGIPANQQAQQQPAPQQPAPQPQKPQQPAPAQQPAPQSSSQSLPQAEAVRKANIAGDPTKAFQPMQNLPTDERMHMLNRVNPQHRTGPVQNFQPQAPVMPAKAQPVSGPTAAQLAQFQRGTASRFDPNSRVDRAKMQALQGGQKNWAVR